MSSARWGRLLLSTAAVWASSGAAQDGEVDRARAHYEVGVSHFERGDYEAALREFDRAHALSGRAALLYNVSL